MGLGKIVPITVEATYEDGVLKPGVPLNLRDKAKVRVTIEEPQDAAADDDDPTGWRTARELIGFIKDGPAEPIGRDHDKYLYAGE
jgi:predicted DNA-binding antitoxin AbrB/MazE fold protein